jgi:hypothetical protein
MQKATTAGMPVTMPSRKAMISAKEASVIEAPA